MGGDGDDSFAQDISEYESGNTGALVMGTSWYSETPGIMPNLLWGGNDAAVSFVFYDPSSVVNAKVLAATTPVELGGATGSLPTLALEGSNQTIASLADVAGAAVTGVVTNSLPIQPAILTIDAASGTTTYTGSITGNLSLVKSGDGTQNLLGSLTYTGDTTVTGGVLNVSSIDNPTATVTVTAGTLTATSLNVDTLIIGETGLAVVPEPSTFVLLFLAGIGMLATVCRRK
jgi:autotransporter-associated beta strand protein